MTEKQIAYQLLGILQEYAPGLSSQQICVKYYQDVQKGAEDREVVRRMVNSLADGLNYGNWPWTLLGTVEK
jgi:hypothetical protein